MNGTTILATGSVPMAMNSGSLPRMV